VQSNRWSGKSDAAEVQCSGTVEEHVHSSGPKTLEYARTCTFTAATWRLHTSQTNCITYAVQRQWIGLNETVIHALLFVTPLSMFIVLYSWPAFWHSINKRILIDWQKVPTLHPHYTYVRRAQFTAFLSVHTNGVKWTPAVKLIFLVYYCVD